MGRALCKVRVHSFFRSFYRARTGCAGAADHDSLTGQIKRHGVVFDNSGFETKAIDNCKKIKPVQRTGFKSVVVFQ